MTTQSPQARPPGLPDDVQLLWLPLAHSFGKVLISAQLQIGFLSAVDGYIQKPYEIADLATSANQVGAAGLLPWTPLLFTPIGRRIGRVADLFVGTREFDLMRWSIAWTAMIFLFFSVSSSKLPGYIVPAFPALAIILALALEKMPTRAIAWALGVNLLIAIGLWFAVPLIGAKAGAKIVTDESVKREDAVKPDEVCESRPSEPHHL